MQSAVFRQCRHIVWGLAVVIPACTAPPLVIAPPELPNGVEGQTYRVDLGTDSSSAESWQIEEGALPAGLHLASSTGTITGTPSEPGTFDFTVRASAGGLPPRSGAQTFTLTVIPRLTLAADLPTGRVDELYDAGPVVAGGVPPYEFEIVGLPAGLAFDALTGVISGTPLSSYTGLTLQISVSDSGEPAQTVTKLTELVIQPRAVAITTTDLPAGQVGTAYSVQLSATGGQTPYSWSVQAGLLPDGLRLNLSTGVISGTPTTAQTATVTIQVTGHENPASTDAREFTIVIDPAS